GPRRSSKSPRWRPGWPGSSATWRSHWLGLNRPSLSFDFLDFFDGIRAILRNVCLLSHQACRYPTLSGLDSSALGGDVGPTGSDGFFQSFGRRLQRENDVLEVIRTDRTYLVLMRLHAVDHAAFARSDRRAVLLDLLCARLLQLRDFLDEPIDERLSYV